jgi:3-oxoacyl-[acyl-carrier protein] reductase
MVQILIPAAGIFRDRLAVKIDRETGDADIYPADVFRQVLEVNLIHPVYWAMETIARIAVDRNRRGLKKWHPDEKVQGTIIFIGSVSSQGNRGQVSYASTKAGLEGAASTLMKEAMFHGVRTGVIHPGFVDTPLLQGMPEGYVEQNILPDTQLGRLIRPEEIADAICFMVRNSAVSGQLWADAGWHPTAA